MTFTMTKTKMALSILVVALAIPATALATHVFNDVPDDAFYAGPVEWAFNEGITTGKSPTQFAPLDGVTRGESVTFLQRYNDNVVEPAIAAVQTAADANASAIAALTTPIVVAHVAHNGGTPTVTGTAGVTATFSGTTGRYTVTVDGVTLSPTTHVVNLMSIRVNSSDLTQDRSAQTFFNAGSVEVSVWDDSSTNLVSNDFHITIFEIPS